MKSRLSSVIKIFFSGQFLKFLGVSGISALIHWVSRLLISEFVEYWLAVVLAYAVGIGVAFVLNRIFVFSNSSKSLRQEISMFTVVNIAAFPFVVAISIALGSYILVPFFEVNTAQLIGHGIGVVSPVLFNFAAHKFITFREIRKETK
jgi:putative flippase GtrA